MLPGPFPDYSDGAWEQGYSRDMFAVMRQRRGKYQANSHWELNQPRLELPNVSLFSAEAGRSKAHTCTWWGVVSKFATINQEVYNALCDSPA